jgi:tripartite-type tricarboxylate transporter receptor subunit TctC
MFGEMFKSVTGIDVVNIPYKSGTQAVPDMLGGRIDINFGTLSNLLPLIREGKVRALAVTSGAQSPDLPGVPTMEQSGFPQLTRGDWIGFWTPGGTSPDIVNRLNREINAAVATPEMKAAMRKLGFEPRIGSSEELPRSSATRLTSGRRPPRRLASCPSERSFLMNRVSRTTATRSYRVNPVRTDIEPRFGRRIVWLA